MSLRSVSSWGGLTSLALVLGGCPGPSVQDLCSKAVARQARCSALSPCEADVATAQCTMEANYERPEFLSALSNCHIDSVPCGAAGDRTIGTCTVDGYNAAIASGGYQHFVQALCNACPALGAAAGATNPPVANCIAASTAQVTTDVAGLGTPTGLVFYAAFSDDTLAPWVACAQHLTTTGAQACMDLQTCVRTASPSMTITHTDAGTCLVSDDASTDGG